MPRIQVEAPAKLNLHLQIGDRRPDGYHAIESLFCALAFGDTLSFETVREPGIAEIYMDWQPPGAPPYGVSGGFPAIPPEKNIISRAVSLFRDRTGYKEGLKITVEKRIPPGGGLGGGSSNAAATLTVLNRLASPDGKGLLSDAVLAEMGASLGSDVPFFLTPVPKNLDAERDRHFLSAAWVSGRGGKQCTPLRGVDEKTLHAPAPDKSSMMNQPTPPQGAGYGCFGKVGLKVRFVSGFNTFFNRPKGRGIKPLAYNKMRPALAGRPRRGHSEVCNRKGDFLSAAWVSGRGELIQPLELPEPARGLSVVLVNPGFSSDTAEAYRLFDVWRRENTSVLPQDSAFLLQSLSKSPKNWLFSNDFLTVFKAAAGRSSAASEAYTTYEHIIAGLKEQGADFAGLSGSGSTCFGVFSGREKAELARENLLLHWPLVICTFLLAH
jgi:4-diphosphocytidyl-2C-methyl-D-erythritol kinase